MDFGALADGGTTLEWLRKRLPGDAQVLFVTPLLDDRPEYVARRLGAEGHDVTDTGSTIARIERHERLRRLRRRQLRAVDWPTESPLSVALERAGEGWSQ